MLSKKIKQYLPDITELRHKYKLGILGDSILSPTVWHFHRHAVARALLIGLFIGLQPLPGHMIMAAILSVLISANLPLAVITVWITNPITLAPISYLEYKVGMWLLQRPDGDFHISWTWQWFVNEFASIWFPMFIGSIFIGLIIAPLAYVLTLMGWRYWIIYQWGKRKKIHFPSSS